MNKQGKVIKIGNTIAIPAGPEKENIHEIITT